jgi:hypothetical protein
MNPNNEKKKEEKVREAEISSIPKNQKSSGWD